MNNNSGNQQEVNECGRINSQSEGSLLDLEDFQVNRMESAGLHSIPVRSADDQNNIQRSKPWTKCSRLCNRKRKGKYRHAQDGCRYLHAEECTICHEPALHPLNPKQQDSHLRKCQARLTWEAERIEASRTVMCSICLDIVTNKETEAGKMFALLENCKHAICWNCYQNIRKLHDPDRIFTEWSRCPECRRPFAFAVPSKFWVEDDENRKRIISKFRVACRRRCCYQFRRTGRCDGGELCIFRHRSDHQVQNDSSEGDDDDGDWDTVGVVRDDWGVDGGVDDHVDWDGPFAGRAAIPENGVISLYQLMRMVRAYVVRRRFFPNETCFIQTRFRGLEHPGRIFVNDLEVPLPDGDNELIRGMDMQVYDIHRERL